MVLGYYLTLDQTVLFNGNYSDSSSLRLSGTCFSDIGKTVAFNLSGYTLTMRLYKDNGFADQFNQTCTINVAASGTFYINITSGTLPTAGFYLVNLELSKSGTVISNLNRVELLVKRGATS